MSASGLPDSDGRETGGPTVILVNFHSLANIESRFESGALTGLHVIVVDNGDDPRGVSRICAAHGAKAILLDHNVGFAAAVNIAAATVDPVDRPWLLLNPDVQLETEHLRELLVGLADGTDGAAPLLAGSDGRLQVGAAGSALTLRSVATYFLLVSHLIPRLRGVFLTRAQSRRASSVSWLCMACLLLAPDAFERFGPIPETELVYAEDVAWGTTASARGARFRLVPGVVVRHDQGGSGGSGRWVGAFERLCRARLGPVRGRLAVAAIRVGLRARRLVGRRVT